MNTAPGVAWYRTSDGLPPLNVAVLVRWPARPAFEAARVRHPHTGRQAWLTEDDAGKPVFLPTGQAPANAREPWIGWHTLKGDPEYWRPQHPEKWRQPLPAPAFVEDAEGQTSAPRMWSSTTGFSAVDEAEAAELAREMEGWRADARAGGRKPDAEDLPDPQWWLDPSTVSYSAPGAISLREAEGRLMRAFNTERWIRLERPSCKTFGSILAQLAKPDPLTAAELAVQDPEPPRTEPTPRDRDDVLTALGWLKATPLVLILRLRAAQPPHTWRAIGRRLEISHETARKWHGQGLAEVHAEANGQPTLMGDLSREMLAKLRARNRAYKRGQ